MPANREYEEIQRHLGFVLQPFGGDADVRQREASISFLLLRANLVHPMLLDALRANPDALTAPRVIEVLPRFGRAESVPVLEEILQRGTELVCEAAGKALGHHPHPTAAGALVRALKSTSALILNAAADGLMVRGEGAACLDLLAVVGHAEGNVRYHAIRAGARLGCLGPADLARIEANDPDPDVRGLARQLIARHTR